jgi:hypothetical protein
MEVVEIFNDISRFLQGSRSGLLSAAALPLAPDLTVICVQKPVDLHYAL